MITLYYTDPRGKSIPCQLSNYDKTKTITSEKWLPKRWFGLTNTWLLEMLGILVEKNQELKFLMALPESKILTDGIKYTIVRNPNFGHKIFWKTFKNEAERYYIAYLPDSDTTKQISRGINGIQS